MQRLLPFVILPESPVFVSLFRLCLECKTSICASEYFLLRQD